MKEETYHIDNEPASASDIIKRARELDEDFDRSGFFQTSVGAGILRRNGHTVGYINEITL